MNMASSACTAACVMRVVSDVGTVRRTDAKLPYCSRSSLKRLLQTKADMVAATEDCALSLLAQLAANVAMDALRELKSETISPKLLLVQMVLRRRDSSVWMQGCPFSSIQVCTPGFVRWERTQFSLFSANWSGVSMPWYFSLAKVCLPIPHTSAKSNSSSALRLFSSVSIRQTAW